MPAETTNTNLAPDQNLEIPNLGGPAFAEGYSEAKQAPPEPTLMPPASAEATDGWTFSGEL